MCGILFWVHCAVDKVTRDWFVFVMSPADQIDEVLLVSLSLLEAKLIENGFKILAFLCSDI